MFGFILGFMIGGVTGAAIVLALSPSYQYQGEEGGGPEDEEGDVPGGQMGEMIKAKARVALEQGKRTLDQAIEEGKVAAKERAAELEELVRKRRGQEEESQG